MNPHSEPRAEDVSERSSLYRALGVSLVVAVIWGAGLSRAAVGVVAVMAVFAWSAYMRARARRSSLGGGAG